MINEKNMFTSHNVYIMRLEICYTKLSDNKSTYNVSKGSNILKNN